MTTPAHCHAAITNLKLDGIYEGDRAAILQLLTDIVSMAANLSGGAMPADMPGKVDQLTAADAAQAKLITDLQAALAKKADTITPNPSIAKVPETGLLSNILALLIQTNITLNKVIVALGDHKIIVKT